MKKNVKKVLKIVVPVTAVVVIAGAMVLKSISNAGEAMADMMAVEAMLVETGDVTETVETNGTVVSGEQKTVFCPVNATVASAEFETGDLVKAGEQLVTFDLKDLEEQNQKAELTIKANELGYQDTINKSNEAAQRQADAKAQVVSLQAQVDAKKQEIANLAAALSGDAQMQAAALQQELENINAQIGMLQLQAEEELAVLNERKAAYDAAAEAQQIAQVNFDAARAVAADNPEGVAVATEALNDANTALSAAKNSYEEQKAVVDSLNNQITELQSLAAEAGTGAGTNSELQQRLETAQSELAELQAKLESQKAIAEADAGTLSSEAKAQMQTNNNLAELESKSLEELIEEGKKGISAEFNGVISDKQVVQGAMVSQGMQLFTLQSIDDVNVQVTLSKSVYEKVKGGQKAEITFAGQTYEGTVTRISRIAESFAGGSNQAAVSSGSITATVHIDNPDDNIFLGVDAKVSILAAEAKDAVILPTEAVNIGKDGTFCWVCEDGILVKRSIQTGVSSDDCIEITDGIAAGDKVIADPGDHEEGDAVTIIEQGLEE